MKRQLAMRMLKKDVDRVRTNPWLYKLGSQFLIDKNFPVHLYLELSFACNYECITCPRKETQRKDFMNVNLAKDIIYEASKYGPTSFSLHIFGEPLMNPDWLTVVNYIKKVNKKNVVLLTTNGSLMDKECSKQLIESGVDRIYVSVHSLVPGIYYKYTNGKSLDVVLGNVWQYKMLGGKNLSLRLFSQDNLEKIRSMNIPYTIKKYHNFAGFRPDYTQLKPQKRYPCWHPWFTLAINTEGNVSVCCADLVPGLCLGNARITTLKRMWGDIKDIRHSLKENKIPSWYPCAKCDVWQYRDNIFFGGQYK